MPQDHVLSAHCVEAGYGSHLVEPGYGSLPAVLTFMNTGVFVCLQH